MIKRDTGVLFICFFLVLGMTKLSFADSAAVLPKGVFRVGLEVNHFLTVDKRYDQDGKLEDIAVNLNANLNSSIFPGLALVEGAFGLPAGSATVGSSVIDYEYENTTFKYQFQYGLTDNISLGMEVPYIIFKNRVKARLDTSNATVGKNAAFNTILPLGVPGTVPLTTQDAQDLIGPGLDINGDGTIEVPGFGFKQIQTFSYNGFGDIEAGFRWQYLRTRDWRLALTSGVRFPTGRLDDPDNLADIGIGSGAWGLLFRFNHDFIISNLWKESPEKDKSGGFLSKTGDLVLNGTFKYTVLLPDKIKKRVTGPNDPLARNKEKVDRDIGDVFEFEASAQYGIFRGVNFSALYRYGFKSQDKYSGDQGFNYSSLEQETKGTSHIYIVGLSYSTLPLFVEKKFPFPLNVSISYRDRFKGSNNVLDSSYIGITLSVLF